jgi:hypothetical protein
VGNPSQSKVETPETARKTELATRVVSDFASKLGAGVFVYQRDFESGAPRTVDGGSVAAC